MGWWGGEGGQKQLLLRDIKGHIHVYTRTYMHTYTYGGGEGGGGAERFLAFSGLARQNPRHHVVYKPARFINSNKAYKKLTKKA